MTSFLHLFDNASMVGFYALALVAIIASLRVVIHANPVHAILSMIVSLLAVAGIFFILGAPFAGALEIIVYAGAILVLFVFVIMMLNLGMANEAREKRWLSAQTWALPTGLALIIALVLFSMIGLDTQNVGVQSELVDTSAAVLTGSTVSAAEVGFSLFTQYLLLVEVAAMLLLAALVAAYHLGKKALDDENVSHSSQKCRYSVIHEDNDTTHVEEVAPYIYQSVDAQKIKDKQNANNSDKSLSVEERR